MHRDYVQSRQAMTQLDAEIQKVLERVDKADRQIQLYSRLVSEWPPPSDIAGMIDDIDQFKYNKKQDLRYLNQLRRQWSFYANNYHRYDDVGAKTSYANDAYMTHQMQQQ